MKRFVILFTLRVMLHSWNTGVRLAYSTTYMYIAINPSAIINEWNNYEYRHGPVDPDTDQLDITVFYIYSDIYSPCWYCCWAHVPALFSTPSWPTRWPWTSSSPCSAYPFRSSRSCRALGFRQIHVPIGADNADPQRRNHHLHELIEAEWRIYASVN